LRTSIAPRDHRVVTKGTKSPALIECRRGSARHCS
jgi:hypothetical protein